MSRSSQAPESEPLLSDNAEQAVVYGSNLAQGQQSEQPSDLSMGVPSSPESAVELASSQDVDMAISKVDGRKGDMLGLGLIVGGCTVSLPTLSIYSLFAELILTLAACGRDVVHGAGQSSFRPRSFRLSSDFTDPFDHSIYLWYCRTFFSRGFFFLHYSRHSDFAADFGTESEGKDRRTQQASTDNPRPGFPMYFRWHTDDYLEQKYSRKTTFCYMAWHFWHHGDCVDGTPTSSDCIPCYTNIISLPVSSNDPRCRKCLV